MRPAVLILMMTVPCLAFADGGVATKTELRRDAAAEPSHTRSVCILRGSLPTEYTFRELGRIKATKRTYGGVDELNRPLADEARRIGADAIINYDADQRFKGPLPWRLRAPTGMGTAVKLTGGPPLDCAALRGESF
jgi:hypothetical protein